MKTARVSWNISADVECPHCEHDNNFMQVDEWHLYTQPGENKEEFFCKIEMTCDKCNKEFIVNGSDY